MLDEEYFLFLRCLLEISLESWSRTRKLNPEGNDAIHFDASFQKATPLSRYHFASSRALSFFFSFSSSSSSSSFDYPRLLRCFNERFLFAESRKERKERKKKGGGLQGICLKGTVTSAIKSATRSSLITREICQLRHFQ